MKIYLILITLFLVSCSPQEKQANVIEASIADYIGSSKKEIKRVLQLQSEAWNNGSLDDFMKGYWKSDSLTFVGSKGLTYGWDSTLSNYKMSYPNKEKMGQLKFKVLSLNYLSKDAFHMIGKYTLTRTEDQPSGFFTLIWRLKDNKWVITADQSN